MKTVLTAAVLVLVAVGSAGAKEKAVKEFKPTPCSAAAMNTVAAVFNLVDAAQAQPITPVSGDAEYLMGCWATGVVDKVGQTFAATLTVAADGTPQVLYSFGGTRWVLVPSGEAVPKGYLAFEAGGFTWAAPLPSGDGVVKAASSGWEIPGE